MVPHNMTTDRCEKDNDHAFMDIYHRQRHRYHGSLLSTNLALDKLQSRFPAHNADAAGLLIITDRIRLLRHVQHLWPEGSTDELSITRRLMQQLRHSSAVLCIEVSIDLVK